MTMPNLFKRKYFFITLLVLAAYSFLPTTASAALIYFTPASGEYQAGDNFAVEVRVDNEGECINAIEAHINYSPNIRVADFSKGDSIATLWAEEPKIDGERNSLSFVAGIPGGYCGRIPGDPGVSNVLGKIFFRFPGFTVGVAASDIVRVEFGVGTKVLRNDGVGSEAKLTMNVAEFKIVENGASPRTEWLDILRGDTIPPEPFTIEMHNDQALYNGRVFLVFGTVDKQTGVDYYEVLESDENGFIRGTEKPAAWKRAQSPYLLEDQRLRSIIKVRAFDKAGNERMIEEISNRVDFKDWPPKLFGFLDTELLQIYRVYIAIGVGFLALFIFLSVFIFLRVRKRKKLAGVV